MNTHVLSWWQKDQPQAKFICIGTSCVYDPAMELKEENYLTGMPIESLFTYAMTKRMLYAGLLALNKQYKLNYLCVVPSTLYGPGYHTDGRQMHFILT
jgi:GDP-L-fucose synthase